MVDRRSLLKTALLTAVGAGGGALVGAGRGRELAAQESQRAQQESRRAELAGKRATAQAREIDRFTQGRRDFDLQAQAIVERHFQQTSDTVVALKRRYAGGVFGKVRVWDMLQKLALCVDPTDTQLYCTNQLIHVQQMVAGMERDGIQDPDLFLSAFVHDLGKVLMLVHEAPENVVCANAPIGKYEPGTGLDNVIFQWNHDEFAYSRLADHVPDHVAWLCRYHSIRLEPTGPYMDPRDRDYASRYLEPFREYDLGTKSTCSLPPADILDKYRDLIEESFPKPILI